MSLSSVAHKCPSEKVWFRSVDQVSLKIVAQKCQSDVLFIKVDQKKCRSEELLRSVHQKKCGSEVLIRCLSKVSLRSVNQKLCSGVSLRTLVRAGKSQLYSAKSSAKYRFPPLAGKIATL